MFDDLKLMENNDPWVKLSTYGKMKKKKCTRFICELKKSAVYSCCSDCRKEKGCTEACPKNKELCPWYK
jgi:hypothetical protein